MSALIIFQASACYAQSKESVLKVSLDSLVAGIEHYVEKSVVVEGIVIHVCGVDGKKIKLKGDSGAVIKIVPDEILGVFDGSLKDKKIRVWGIAGEKRIDSAYIDSLQALRKPVCHVDHQTCKSESWREKLEKEGVLDQKMLEAASAMREKVAKSDKGYYSRISILASKIEEIPPD